MKTQTSKMSEDEIDQLVTEQADDDRAWEKPETVTRNGTAIELSSDLAARAAFLARLHRRPSMKDWLSDIIRERIELEEAAYSAAKKELAHPGRGSGE